MKPRQTSWEKSGKWYHKLVGAKGHYFHEHVIIPKLLNLLQLDAGSKLLDIGCGDGFFSRFIPKEADYTGIDLAPGLVGIARREYGSGRHKFIAADATRKLPIENHDFTHAVAILSLQNMEHPEYAIREAAKHLAPHGLFAMVLNHPCFRIPRQSGWGTGDNKIQYRYINRYMSSLSIPINMHPGERNSQITWSFHHPISFYARAIRDSGLVIGDIEEWVSDKESVGSASRAENTGRREIPLFLAIVARKN